MQNSTQPAPPRHNAAPSSASTSPFLGTKIFLGKTNPANPHSKRLRRIDQPDLNPAKPGANPLKPGTNPVKPSLNPTFWQVVRVAISAIDCARTDVKK
jgi:hypothetical protein